MTRHDGCVWQPAEVFHGAALIAGLSAGLVFGLVLGAGIALVYGGQAYMSHLVLRLAFWRTGAMPLDYVRFLEYAADMIFLTKVGAGYRFKHALLQQYFEAQETVSSAHSIPKKA